MRTPGLRFDVNCSLADAGVQLALLNFAGGDIAHIQVADVPDRGAPRTGELDFEALFGQLTAQGYAGWIGCEYKPSDPADSSTSFGWREPDEV